MFFNKYKYDKMAKFFETEIEREQEHTKTAWDAADLAAQREKILAEKLALSDAKIKSLQAQLRAEKKEHG